MKKINKNARRNAPLFFCILLVAVFELTGALTATAQQTDYPTPLACVDPTPQNGRYNVKLAYDNPQTVVVFHSAQKPLNYFEPNAQAEYYGQSSFFEPGYNEIAGFAFSIASGQSTTWVLGFSGQQKRVLIDPSNPATHCPAPITFQGRLSNAGAAATGTFDLQFTAYDAVTGGRARSTVIVKEDVAVTNGVFTVYLDTFTAFLNRNVAKFLEIGVRRGASTGAFTILTPRQPITPAPYAITAQTAFSAINATNATDAINAVNATNVSGGFVQLPQTTLAPPVGECNETSERGRMKVDVTANRLYICTATGWKSTVLQ